MSRQKGIRNFKSRTEMTKEELVLNRKLRDKLKYPKSKIRTLKKKIENKEILTLKQEISYKRFLKKIKLLEENILIVKRSQSVISKNDRNRASSRKRLGKLPGRYKAWQRSSRNSKNPIKREWNLSLKYLKTLPIICFWTGRELTFEIGHFNTISLDRIDSSKGYIKGNVCFCCQKVNRSKLDMTEQEFIQMAKDIVKNRSVT